MMCVGGVVVTLLVTFTAQIVSYNSYSSPFLAVELIPNKVSTAFSHCLVILGHFLASYSVVGWHKS